MKYPRTFHLPWSPGGTSDDKRLKSVESFLNNPIVISEKLDGSNCCLNREGVFARSHNQIATHASFNYVKTSYQKIKYLLKDGEELFGENCFAVHSIEYGNLPDYFFLFGIRINKNWLSFDNLKDRGSELGLTLAPILFEGIVKTETELEHLTNCLSKEQSVYGGCREGVVVRERSGFKDSDFAQSVSKWVRKDHVQSDDHWAHQAIRKQNKA